MGFESKGERPEEGGEPDVQVEHRYARAAATSIVNAQISHDTHPDGVVSSEVEAWDGWASFANFHPDGSVHVEVTSPDGLPIGVRTIGTGHLRLEYGDPPRPCFDTNSILATLEPGEEYQLGACIPGGRAGGEPLQLTVTFQRNATDARVKMDRAGGHSIEFRIVDKDAGPAATVSVMNPAGEHGAGLTAEVPLSPRSPNTSGPPLGK